MPRPQAFDRDEVIDSLTNVFWERGYSATSISDLQAAAKLGRQSLYNSFGDKDTLYALALTRYIEQLDGLLLTPLASATDVHAGFREVLDNVVAAAVADEARKGCMLVNSTTELVSLGEEVRESVISAEKRYEDAFTQAIERGQAKGQINRNKNPRKLALQIYNSIIGIRIRARYKPSRINLQAIATSTLELLR